MRRVDFLAGLDFDFADRQDVTRALVQEFDELRVEGVNGLTMLRNVHAARDYRTKHATAAEKRRRSAAVL